MGVGGPRNRPKGMSETRDALAHVAVVAAYSLFCMHLFAAIFVILRRRKNSFGELFVLFFAGLLVGGIACMIIVGGQGYVGPSVRGEIDALCNPLRAHTTGFDLAGFDFTIRWSRACDRALKMLNQ